MSFSINTNIASLQAQHYLNQSQSFQGKTIQQVTSGLRIVSSGDDAAGLAVANGYRSDEAVLTQGILNANNGLSQLQIADGGLNNISQLLDRASTLATESASGTFTGQRAPLNAEFQSVITEINRQAQAIGLNTGGLFAQDLQVFIGGGKASGNISAITNGSETLDLSQATVDAKSLGLQGVRASGVAGTDIGASSATSVQSILSQSANTATEAQPGYTTFYVSGPGYGGTNKVAVSVNLSGVTDANTLVTAINNGITAAGNGNSQYATAFKNANVTASLNTANGTQLAFTSSNAAFQVQAGDQVANALLGNFASTSGPTAGTGNSLAETVTAATPAGTGTTAFANNVVVQFQGAGLAAPVNITLKTANDATIADALTDLSSQVSANSALQAAGISFTGSTTGGTAITFASNRGESFSVATAGDLTNQLGLGSYAAANTASPVFGYSTITGTANVVTNSTAVDTLEFSVAGGAGIQVSVTGTGADTAQTLADQLNSQIQTSATLRSAGISATVSGGDRLVLTSGNGTNFRVTDVAASANHILGFAGDGSGTFTNGANSTNAAVAASAGNNAFFDSGGATATGPLTFNGIQFGGDTQTLNFSAVDSSGAPHPVAVSLTAANAGSLDQAIASINSELQKTSDPTLQQITAVKEYNTSTHAYGINFISTLNNFSVGLGQVGNGQTEGHRQCDGQWCAGDRGARSCFRRRQHGGHL